MKSTFLNIILCLSITSAFSQNYYEIISGGTKSDVFTGGTLVDNGYVLCGWSNSYGVNGADVLLHRYDNAGTLLWSKTIGAATNSNDRATVIIQTVDKGFLVGGSTLGGMNGYIIKTDSLANPQWAKVVAYAYYDSICDLKQTPDKGYILTGICSENSNAYFLFLIKIDSIGNVKWKKQYNAYWYGIGRSVIVTNDGNYLAVGGVGGPTGYQKQCYAIKVDTAGNTIWEYAYGSTAAEECWSVTEVSGNYYALSEAQCVSYGFGLLKITPDGSLSWAKCIEHSNTNLGSFPKRILRSGDGNLLLTGMGAIQYLTASRNQMLLIKTDLSGNVLWTNSYGDPKRMESSNVVLEMPDGTLLLAGYSYDFDTQQPSQLYQVRTDFNGYIPCTTNPYPDTLVFLSFTKSTISQPITNLMNVTATPADIHLSSTPVIDFQCGTSVTTMEISDKTGYIIYPNPTNGILYIVSDNILFSEKKIEIYNSLGEKVYSVTGNKLKETINLNLTNGIYFLHIGANKNNTTGKIILNK